MLNTLLTIAALPIGLMLFMGIRLLMLARTVSADPASLEIDPRRYRPMERLLREQDIRYLVSQGLERKSINRLRAQRRAIFRKYLRSLRGDFGRIVGVVRLAMVESSEARPDLATAVVRARIFFAYTVVLLEMRLWLHALGWSGITINVRPAIVALENMREQWELSMALSGAAA